MNAIVVGGGAFGSLVAYMLAREGQQVTLLDKDLPGRATSASAGGLWAVGESIGLGCGVIFHAKNGQVDTAGGPQPLPRHFMEFLLESNRYFPSLSGEIAELTGIDIETEQGTGLLYVSYNEAEAGYADGLLDWLNESDVTVEKWSAEEVCRREPLMTREQLGGVYFPGDNQVNPMLLADGAKRAAMKLGAVHHSDTEVTGIRMNGNSIAGVETNQGYFECDLLVNAAGTWSGKLAEMAGVDIPIFPVRGQILCTEALQGDTLNFNLSTSDCYILQKSHGEILVGSTTEFCGFNVDVPLENLVGLATGVRRALPGLGATTVKRSWSGLRPGTPDEFPILGPVSSLDNYYNATGGFRTGIVGAPLSAAIVVAHIMGNDQPFEPEYFLASRFDTTDFKLSDQIGEHAAELSTDHSASN